MGGASSEKPNLPTQCVAEEPIFESYRVRPEIFEDIIKKLGTEKPQIDLFADRTNKLCEKFWSAEDDSFSKEWKRDEFMWCNPPYSMLGRVVEKIKTDGARGILIAPDWQTREWWGPLEDLVTRNLYFPKWTKMCAT